MINWGCTENALVKILQYITNIIQIICMFTLMLRPVKRHIKSNKETKTICESFQSQQKPERSSSTSIFRYIIHCW